jgi:hypothetical protein
MDDIENGSEHEAIREARLWRDNGWTAQVIKNEDDDGWAVAMTPAGQVEPALVGPWTGPRQERVSPGFKLTRARAGAWAEAGFSAEAAR